MRDSELFKNAEQVSALWHIVGAVGETRVTHTVASSDAACRLSGNRLSCIPYIGAASIEAPLHVATSERQLDRAHQIKMVSAGCGRGKTYSTCQHIKGSLYKSNHVYVAPTIYLLQQTARQLEELGVSCVAIHSSSHDNPKRTVIEFLKSCTDCGHVLLITWATYSELPYFHQRQNWHAYIDEVPQVDRLHKHRVPHNASFLTEFLDCSISINETTGLVAAKNKNHLQMFMEQKCGKDDVYEVFRPLLEDVLNESKDVFVCSKGWGDICENRNVGERDEENTVYFISMLNPRLFRRSTLLGANIESSMLYVWLTQYHGVDFINDAGIASNLREYSPVGERLRLTYFIREKRWSKNLRDKEKGGRRVIDVIEKCISKEIGDQPFLLVANNDYKGSLASQPNCKRIAVDSKGVNDFQDYTKIVHLPALNREPKHYQMLKHLGINDETIQTSTGYEVLYQNVMRTALRNPASNEAVGVFVPTEFEADFLISQFGAGSKREIGDLEFKKCRPLTQVQKNRRSKVNKLLDNLPSTDLIEIGELPVSGYQLSYVNNDGNHNPANKLDSNGPPRAGHLLTFCHSVYATEQDEFIPYAFESFRGLVKLLKTFSKEVVDDKEDVLMVNPIAYSVDGDGKYRKQANFQTATMLVLDFDNGDLSPDQFCDMFWDKAGRGQKRSFIIANSYSRSPEKPNRFRVFLPFKQPASSYAEYRAVYDSIVDRLELHGYTEKSSGLDRTAANGVQPFYLPCTNREHPDWRYFKAKGVEAREIDRYAIDPSSYLRTAAAPSERTKVIPISRLNREDGTSAEVLERKLCEIENSVRVLTEGRRTPFYTAGLHMLHLGLSLTDIEIRLSSLAAEIGKSDTDWVKGVMKSLSSATRWAA